MSPSDERKSLGDAVIARKDARHALQKKLSLVHDMGRRLVDLGTRLEQYTEGDMTKEKADGRLTFRQHGLIRTALYYPSEEDVLETVNECDQLIKDIDRLTQVIGE